MSKALCTFRVGGRLFGIEVERVQEVFRAQTLTRVPLAAHAVSGLMNLRGQIVVALDLRRRLGLAEDTAAGRAMNVVIHAEEGPIGLIVDSIGDVLNVEDRAFEPPPDTLRASARALLRGAYKLPEELLFLLDTVRVVELSQDGE
jgi:purine-binding chemotaxis protein CheW